ncbi:Biopolymer transport protein [Gloeomargarita lithophora Alchichica-D10]|uniref:Biopolymer transport protein n=1 Tax=Gloeomargarita lithophora Alchichica-D10 TaxID=1188229 RepID=A0A1J0AD20_9CYAN|nr:biopolymer transporter ExbD [Gloeomargarita lithophora]APB33808.1 Biopolymer transport protein [Gloeomargarita lithophora Alchichica-D10]
MRLNEENEAPAQINIVPMIDVIFAILVYFIVSTLSLTRLESLPVNLPGASTAQVQDAPPVTVSLTREGTVAINQKTVPVGEVQNQVRALVPTGQNTVVVINADREANYGQVVAIMDQLRQIPGVRIAVATKRP